MQQGGNVVQQVTDILAVLLPLLAAAVPVARVLVQHKVTPDQLGHVRDIARMAVRATEEIAEHFKGEDPELWAAVETWSEAKSAYASTVIAEGAKRLGVTLTQDEVDAFLHSALREMRQLADEPLPVAMSSS